MKNIKLTIQYDGTKYAGWQTQKNAVSIQETIETVLRRIIGSKVHVRASGRTDAGVHAKAQVANFRTSCPIPLKNLQMALNGRLPKDIVVSHLEEASRDFNAQHDARSKIYRYTIVNNDFVDPFLRDRAAKVFYKLDIGRMKRAARLIKGRHDFKAFQAVDGREIVSVKTIKGIAIKKRGDVITIDIEADGFLYNMVRNIVGTLVEIGRGKFEVSRVAELFRSKDRRLCGPTMPAKGLCLIEVKY